MMPTAMMAPTVMLPLVLLFLAAANAKSPTGPLNLTLYRVSPLAYPGLIDMDTGDPAGDIGFGLWELLMPMQCRPVPGSSSSHHHMSIGCENGTGHYIHPGAPTNVYEQFVVPGIPVSGVELDALAQCDGAAFGVFDASAPCANAAARPSLLSGPSCAAGYECDWAMALCDMNTWPQYCSPTQACAVDLLQYKYCEDAQSAYAPVVCPVGKWVAPFVDTVTSGAGSTWFVVGSGGGGGGGDNDDGGGGGAGDLERRGCPRGGGGDIAVNNGSSSSTHAPAATMIEDSRESRHYVCCPVESALRGSPMSHAGFRWQLSRERGRQRFAAAEMWGAFNKIRLATRPLCLFWLLIALLR